MRDFIIRKSKRNIFFKIIGVALILGFWQIIASFSHPLIVPSIELTVKALFKLITSGEAAANLAVTINRQLLGLAIGVLLGVGIGILGGLSRSFHETMMPLINTILATPSVLFVVMALVWFGVGGKQVVFVVALLVLPIMYINSAKTLHSIDNKLLQMVQVFHVSWPIRLRKIYLPGVLHGFIAGITLSVATSLRVAVFAEVLGAGHGVGPAIALARNYLETDTLFAWAVLLILLVAAVEFFILRPVENFAKRWN